MKFLTINENKPINLKQVKFIETITDDINVRKTPSLRFWFSKEFHLDWHFDNENQRDLTLKHITEKIII